MFLTLVLQILEVHTNEDPNTGETKTEETVIMATEGKGHAFVPAILILGKPGANPIPGTSGSS